MMFEEDRIEKRWGWEHVLVETDEYCVKYLLMRRDQRCSMHYHEHKHETVTCLIGKLVIRFHNRNLPSILLYPGQSRSIPAGKENTHAMRAEHEFVDTLYLESSGAGHLDDAIRIAE